MIKNKNLQFGDLIGVSFQNGIQPAIFKKYGKNGNPSFYYVSTWNTERIKDSKKIYSTYIFSIGRIVPINEEVLEDQSRANYHFIKKHLIEENGK